MYQGFRNSELVDLITKFKSIVNFNTRSIPLMAGLLLTSLLSTVTYAEVRIAGSNSSNGEVFGICFDDLNGDGLSDPRKSISIDGGTSPVSMAFYLDRAKLSNDPLTLFVADSKGAIRSFDWVEFDSEVTSNACDFTPTAGTKFNFEKAPQNQGPTNPTGLAVTKTNYLFALNSKSGKKAKSEVWRFDLESSEAFQNPTLLDSDVKIDGTPADLLEESLMLLNGDLLVLSSSPAAIVKYDVSCNLGSGPCSPTTLIPPEAFGGNSPAGMTLAPIPLEHKLLVSISDGSVMVFDLITDANGIVTGATRQLDASGQPVDFITGLDSGRFKLKAVRSVRGEDSSENFTAFAGTLFIAGRNNGKIIEVKIQDNSGVLVAETDANGNPVYESLNEVQFPVGIAVTEAEWTPVIDCVEPATCSLVPVISHQIQVPKDAPVEDYLVFPQGSIGAEYEVYPDPRLIACDTPGQCTCKNEKLYLSDLNPGYDAGVYIPEYLCGSPNIIVVDISLSDEVDLLKGIVEHEAENSNINPGFDCKTGISSTQPVMGWATKAGEDPVVEDNMVVDVTTGCGSTRGGTVYFSYFTLGLHYANVVPEALPVDSYSYLDIIDGEISRLRQTFNAADNEGTCISDPSELEALLSEMEDRWPDAQCIQNVPTLASNFADLIASTPSLISPKGAGCSKNFTGELRARARHIWYNINSKVFEYTWDDAEPHYPLGYCNTPPVASFEHEACALNQPCAFTNNSSDVDSIITSYNWDFGDGTSSTVKNPSHTFTSSGSYVVTLTATDDGVEGDRTPLSTTTTKTIVVNAPPVASFADVSCDAGVSCSFDASTSSDDSGISSYSWDFGDGSLAGSGVKPTHTYNTGGSYQVTLTVSDGSLTDEITKTVAVNAPPVARFADVSCDASLPCSFDANTSSDDSGISSYSWDFGDGKSATGVTPSHIYNTGGSYQVTLTVSDGSLTDNITKTVAVNAAPIASFVHDACNINQACSFDASASSDDGAITSYNWSFGDGSNGTGVSPTHTYTSSGSFQVTLTITDGVLTNTITKTVVVNGAPVASIGFSCSSYECSFDGSSSTDDSGITSYSWDFGDGGSASGSNPSHTYTTEGEKTVTLTVTDAAGLSNSTSYTLYIYELSTKGKPRFTWTCTGLSCTFTVSQNSNDGSNIVWEWLLGDGSTATGDVVVHTYDAAGTYPVRVTKTPSNDYNYTAAVTVSN